MEFSSRLCWMMVWHDWAASISSSATRLRQSRLRLSQHGCRRRRTKTSKGVAALTVVANRRADRDRAQQHLAGERWLLHACECPMITFHEGGCACGSVRYQVRGDPEICQTCHCRFCQRRLGTAFATVAYFDERNVTVLQGELKTFEHRSDETGRWLRMQFCPRCGTTHTHRTDTSGFESHRSGYLG